MARIMDLLTPTIAGKEKIAKSQWNQAMQRYGSLTGARYHEKLGWYYDGDWHARPPDLAGGGYGFEEGPEFQAARSAYQRAAGPVSDVSGVGNLNAAERAALIEARENIGEQAQRSTKELQNVVGRMGGGGSEFQEMAGDIQTGATSARVQALRDVLARAQGTREEAKDRAMTAAGGLFGLASLREQGRQFGAQYGLTAMQQRMALLDNMAPQYNLGGAGGADFMPGSVGTMMGGQQLGQGWSPNIQATELRNQFIWPTQYGVGNASASRAPSYYRWY